MQAKDGSLDQSSGVVKFWIYFKGRAQRILWPILWPISCVLVERGFKDNTNNFNMNNWKNGAFINYRMWKITGGSG